MPRAKNFAGRGLDSLSTNEADFSDLFSRHLTPRQTSFQDVAIERIRPNPFQARRAFDNISDLADAIRAQGFITRLRVRPDPSQEGIYQLVFGERRLRAAKEAGLTTVPCEIAAHTDDEMIEIGLAENIQRRDLDPLEEAEAFRVLLDQRGYTHQRLAERIGKDRSYVEDRLALLRVPEDVQQMVALRPDTLRAAREIAKLQDAAERRPLIEGVVAGHLTTTDIHGAVRERSNQVDQDAEGTRTRTTGPRQATQPMSRLGQTVDRDILTLRTIFSRWRQGVPKMNDGERAQILKYIEEHLVELERLTEALR